MMSNSKRFVAKVWPVFWFQDRVEVLFWRRWWRVTDFWVGGHAFLCYFPRMVLPLPHLILIGIILSAYRYPLPQPPFRLQGLHYTSIGSFNNGRLTSQHPSDPESNGPICRYAPPQPRFPRLIYPSSPSFIVHVAFASGTATRRTVHPPHSPPPAHSTPTRLRRLVTCVYDTDSSAAGGLGAVFVHAANSTIEVIEKILEWVQRYAPWLVSLPPPHQRWQGEKKKVDEKIMSVKHLKMALRRWMDDEKLSDLYWNSEMRVVELWENERLAGIRRRHPCLRDRSVAFTLLSLFDDQDVS
ncbi:hypothetical protein BDQ17DRAFT_860594 [Cyathus striatus]|nr:hypothetical protein BDQ17DRAFT_860594 [Cyathus striatus]